MNLRSWFYAYNEEKVKSIISPVVEDYKNGKIDYNKACFNACVKIYQSINPNFNPDVEYAMDSCYRDFPSVDSSYFIIARKLIFRISLRIAFKLRAIFLLK